MSEPFKIGERVFIHNTSSRVGTILNAYPTTSFVVSHYRTHGVLEEERSLWPNDGLFLISRKVVKKLVDEDAKA